MAPSLTRGTLHLLVAATGVTAAFHASDAGGANIRENIPSPPNDDDSETTMARRLSPVTNFFAPSNDPFSSMFPRESIPQFIVLTFDDGITPLAVDWIKQSLDGVRSKNGCPIAATFYISIAPSNEGNPLTKCDLVQGLRKGHHEIATHTYGHTGNPTEEDIINAVDYLNDTCGVPREEMRGFRTPNLGFTQDTFDRLHKLGFLYDSSISDNGLTSNLGADWIWPYTMDGGIAQDCASSAGRCNQTKSNPGLWEVPMWRAYDENDVAMIVMDWPGDAYGHLSRNFQRRYDGNRAPLGIFLHAGWLALHGGELRKWVTETLEEYDDVYFVTNYELLQWMSNPVPSSDYQERDCGDVVTDCFPPPAAEGGCNYGTYDAIKCECVCEHPWGGYNCMTQISHEWTPDPTPKPTSSPTTWRPTVTTSPTVAPTSPPTVSPSALPTTLVPSYSPTVFSTDSPTSAPASASVPSDASETKSTNAKEPIVPAGSGGPSVIGTKVLHLHWQIGAASAAALWMLFFS